LGAAVVPNERNQSDGVLMEINNMNDTRQNSLGVATKMILNQQINEQNEPRSPELGRLFSVRRKIEI
jgi:hypothetical protein